MKEIKENPLQKCLSLSHTQPLIMEITQVTDTKSTTLTGFSVLVMYSN